MAAIVLAAAVAGRVSGRLGPRPPVVLGTALAGTSLLLLSVFAVGGRYVLWWPLLALMGLGVGMVMSPNNAALVGSAPADAAGQAASMGGAAQQVGALLGVASLGIVLAGTAFADATGAAHGASAPDGPGREALAVGIERGLLLAGACYLAAAVLAASLIRPERTGARRYVGGRQTVQR
ncbi:MFS transporter [Streptomyces radiopugnans]|nr:MFS transporter [Streptomyces radiopugnans]